MGTVSVVTPATVTGSAGGASFSSLPQPVTVRTRSAKTEAAFSILRQLVLNLVRFIILIHSSFFCRTQVLRHARGRKIRTDRIYKVCVRREDVGLCLYLFGPGLRERGLSVEKLDYVAYARLKTGERSVIRFLGARDESVGGLERLDRRSEIVVRVPHLVNDDLFLELECGAGRLQLRARLADRV